MESTHSQKAVWPTFLWALLAFCFFGVIVVFAVRFYEGRFVTYPVKRAQERLENLKKLREQEEQQLNSYAWKDKKAGLVQLPIDRAMELVVADLRKKTVHPSGVAVPTPAPAGAEAPAAATAEETSATASTSPAAASPSPAAGAAPPGAAPAASPAAPAH